MGIVNGSLYLYFYLSTRKKSSIHVMKDFSMERLSTRSNASSKSLKETDNGSVLLVLFVAVILVSKCTIGYRVDLSLTNPKIMFILGGFHRSLIKTIISIIVERVDNSELKRWASSFWSINWADY